MVLTPDELFPGYVSAQRDLLGFRCVDVPRLDYSPALNDSDQHDDDRDHKKQMNKTAAHVRNEAQQPENDENNCNRPKHVTPPIGPGSRHEDAPCIKIWGGGMESWI